MNILEFPCILLLHIFVYIDKRSMISSVRKVCKYFHRLSFDRSLWKTVTMDQFPPIVFTTKSFHELLRRVQNFVQCLHLDTDKLDDIGVLHEGITCTSLKELYIYAPPDALEDNCSDRVYDLEQLIEATEEWEHIISLKKYLSNFGERYPKLKALHIQSGGLNVGYLSDKYLDLETFSIREGVLQDSCREFFENHPSIKHLSLTSCMIEPSAVPIVLSQLPRMETLDLSRTLHCVYDLGDMANLVEYDQLSHIRELCVDDTKYKLLSQICTKMPELRKLSIRGSLVQDKELIEIAKHCPKLETLLINDSMWTSCYITNDALCAIAASCTNLQVLQTNYCTKVDHIGIERIIESCPNICELGIAKCTTLTDVDMMSLVEKCPRIQKLNLRECRCLTSKSISAILIGCRNLTDLDLQACCKLMDIRFTDASTPTISSTGDDLENEAVEKCVLENEMAKKIEETKDHKLPITAHSHVRTLNLQWCDDLSDKCLEQISSFCPDLRDVNLEYSSIVSNVGVSYLVQNCTLLEKLTCGLMCNYSKPLSDECLSTIAKYCKSLRVLSMWLNIHITADGILDVIRNCPRIEHIKAYHHEYIARLNLDMNKLKMLVGKVTGKIVRIEDAEFLNIYIYRDYHY